MAGALDCDCELTLMISAGAGNSSGKNLRTLACAFAQTGYVLVINMVYLVAAERANLFLLAHR